MASVLLLPDSSLLTLLRIEVDEHVKTITATATTTAPTACCPLCQQPSRRVQSRYVRTLADLPCSGQRVSWQVQVRRFWCQNAQCPRKLFCERLPTCAPPYARRTLRQAETICAVALAVGGTVGERVLEQLAPAMRPCFGSSVAALPGRSRPRGSWGWMTLPGKRAAGTARS
jgi:transposase